MCIADKARKTSKEKRARHGLSAHLVESLIHGAHYTLLAADHALNYAGLRLHRLVEESSHGFFCERFRSRRAANVRGNGRQG